MHTQLRLPILAVLTILVALLPPVPDTASARDLAAPEAIGITIDHIVASGFDLPVQVTHAGDGSGRLFVVEQTGAIRIIDAGTVLPTPFLDLSSTIACCGERGLLSMAFHPDYPTNRLLYVNYTRAGDGATVVARYAAAAGDPNAADPASAATLMVISQPYTNHNGGQIAFGPDGYLYVGMGDGGSGGDPLEAGQDPTTLLGALLRIDVDGGTPYVIPPDNPYVGTAGQDEIWAIGLRNPWRFSFDRGTGDLYIGDVGQNLWEEISFAAAGTPGGVNFGWDCREGAHTYEWDAACSSATLIDPIAEYSHDEGRSVSGGFVYRGLKYPDLFGTYFYADYVNGRIWSLTKTQSGFTSPALELDTSLLITGFGEDELGELYVVDRNGSIRLLADIDGEAPPPDLGGSSKRPSTPVADRGEDIAYTLVLANGGGPVPGTVTLTDTLPAGLTYIADSLAATGGAVDDSDAPALAWTGTLGERATVTITYQAHVTGVVTGSLVNRALVGGPYLDAFALAAAVSVPRNVLATTVNDLVLPGTQPSGLTSEIANSVDCDSCHSEPIYDAWRGTLMSQAGRDPLMYAALAAANANAPNAGDYCLRCHTPKAWLEGRSHPADGSAQTPTDIDNGVACAVCHRAVDPLPTAGQLPSTDLQVRSDLTATVPLTYTGSGTLIIDPNDNRRGPFAFDPALSYHTAYQTAYVGQDAPPPADNAVTRSRLCGTCHDVDNPVLSWDDGRGQYWPNAMDTPTEVVKGDLFPIERTYTEWLLSDYPTGVVAPVFAGDTPSGTVSACQDCHMERQTGTAADAAFNPTNRDCATTGCLPEHAMVGGNAWVPTLILDPAWRLDAAPHATYLSATAQRARTMLRRAATLSITLTTQGAQKLVNVRVTNESGHKLPTGYPEGRQMWLNVRAYDATGAVVYESGVYDWDTHTLVRDPDIRVYEAKQGLTPEIATVLGKPAGESFHFVLNNTVIKDNRIPPRGYSQVAWDLPGVRPVGAVYLDDQHWDDVVYDVPDTAVRSSAILYYQTASREYIDFLAANGGVDGESLNQLWTASPSPPVLMTLVSDPAIHLYMPIIYRN